MTDVGVAVATDRLRPLGEPAGVAGLAILGAAVLHLRDPHVAGGWGPVGAVLCPFHAVTGLWCPGCGGTRAVADLVRLDVAEAIGHNVLAVALVATLVVAWGLWVRRRWRGEGLERMIVLGPRASVAVFVAMAVFTVARNLPFAQALAP